jgi:hypothetical protein
MGRTIASFRIVLEMEKKEWKPFRNALDKKEKNEFDDMFDIARLYITSCSNSVQLVPLQPIFISILFHHYKELMQLKAQVDQVKEEEEEQPKEVVGDEYVTNTRTLDKYFIISNRITESQ